MKSLFKNAIFNLIRSCMSLIFPIITFTYATRILLPEGMGKIEFSKSFVAYFNIMAMLGIVNYGTREGAKIRDNRERLSKFAQELFLINIMSVCVVLVIFGVTLFCIPRLSDYLIILLIYSVTIPLTALGMEWLYNAVEDYKYVAIRTSLIQVASVILMLLFVRTKNDLWKYALIQVIASSGNNLLNFMHSCKYLDLYPLKKNISLRRHIKSILVLFCITLFIQVFTHMDSTMLGFMTNNRYVGLYAAAGKMTGMVSTMITALSLVTMPRIAYYVGQNNQSEICRLSVRIINLIMLLGIPTVIGMIMLSRNLILLFCGYEYLEADIAAKIMSLRIVLIPLNSFILLHLFIPLGKEKGNLLATGSAALVNLLANRILIPAFYHLGAAVATIIAEGMELIVNIYFLAKFVNICKIFHYVWQYILAGLSIVIICLISDKMISSLLISTFVSIGGSIFSYFTILAILHNDFVKEIVKDLNRKYKPRRHF